MIACNFPWCRNFAEFLFDLKFQARRSNSSAVPGIGEVSGSTILYGKLIWKKQRWLTNNWWEKRMLGNWDTRTCASGLKVVGLVEFLRWTDPGGLSMHFNKTMKNILCYCGHEIMCNHACALAYSHTNTCEENREQAFPFLCNLSPRSPTVLTNTFAHWGLLRTKVHRWFATNSLEHTSLLLPPVSKNK